MKEDAIKELDKEVRDSASKQMKEEKSYSEKAGGALKTASHVARRVAPTKFGSLTSAWRYASQKPKARLHKTQRYTRVLEARYQLSKERQRQKVLEAALRSRQGVTGTGLSQRSGFFVDSTEYQNRQRVKGNSGFLGNSGGGIL